MKMNQNLREFSVSLWILPIDDEDAEIYRFGIGTCVVMHLLMGAVCAAVEICWANRSFTMIYVVENTVIATCQQ